MVGQPDLGAGVTASTGLFFYARAEHLSRGYTSRRMSSPPTKRALALRFILWFSILLLVAGFGVYQSQLNRKYEPWLAQLNALQLQDAKNDRAMVFANSVHSPQLRKQATVHDAEVRRSTVDDRYPRRRRDRSRHWFTPTPPAEAPPC